MGNEQTMELDMPTRRLNGHRGAQAALDQDVQAGPDDLGTQTQ
jgi:hypothetical protein